MIGMADHTGFTALVGTGSAGRLKGRIQFSRLAVLCHPTYRQKEANHRTPAVRKHCWFTFWPWVTVTTSAVQGEKKPLQEDFNPTRENTKRQKFGTWLSKLVSLTVLQLGPLYGI